MQYQITHPEEKGISANELLNLCIELMILMSMRDLKQQLNEAKDHKLIIERSDEGTTMYQIPYNTHVLDKILSEEL